MPREPLQRWKEGDIVIIYDFIKACSENDIDVVLHDKYSGLTIVGNIEVIKKDKNLWFLRDADVESWNTDGNRIRIEYSLS